MNDWIKELYLNLMEDIPTQFGVVRSTWTLTDIDDMDIMYYLELLSYKANKEYRGNVDTVLNIL